VRKRQTDDETQPEVTGGGGEDAGFFALLEQMVIVARADARHIHSVWACCDTAEDDAGPGRPATPILDRCDIRESAEQFLKDIRSGVAGIWSEWLDLASMRSGGPEKVLTDDTIAHVRESGAILGIRRLGKNNRHLAPSERKRFLAAAHKGGRGFSREEILEHARRVNLLTVEQAQEYLSLSKTFREKVTDGRIPVAARYGCAMLFAKADLDEARKTEWWAHAQRRRAALIKPIPAEEVVTAGFAVDARGFEEFRRLCARQQREKNLELVGV
jgi:excisionase family DNA binding protein